MDSQGRIGNGIDLLRGRLPYVRGKRVLDIGSIGHAYSGGYKTWNFARLAEVASEIQGLDFLADEVEKPRADGHDIIVADDTEPILVCQACKGGRPRHK